MGLANPPAPGCIFATIYCKKQYIWKGYVPALKMRHKTQYKKTHAKSVSHFLAQVHVSGSFTPRKWIVWKNGRHAGAKIRGLRKWANRADVVTPFSIMWKRDHRVSTVCLLFANLTNGPSVVRMHPALMYLIFEQDFQKNRCIKKRWRHSHTVCSVL